MKILFFICCTALLTILIAEVTSIGKDQERERLRIGLDKHYKK